MELVSITYEEQRERYFKKQISELEERLQRYTGYGSSYEVHEICSEIGCQICFYKDALESTKGFKRSDDE